MGAGKNWSRKTYQAGLDVRSMPEASTVKNTHKAGYLRQYVDVARDLLSRGDKKAVPVWAVSIVTGHGKRLVERAGVSMGLRLVYIEAESYSESAHGLRRAFLVDHAAVRAWIEEVKVYRDSIRGRP